MAFGAGRSLPIFNTIGCGSFSYDLVVSTAYWGMRRYLILADSPEIALGLVSNTICPINSWQQIRPDTIEISFVGMETDVSLLYLS